MANLSVIFSNDQPKREEKYPRTWLLYEDKDKDTIEIRIKHHSHPLMHEVDFEHVGSVVHMHQKENGCLDVAHSPRR